MAKRRKPDGPQARYELARRRGETDESALLTVASSYGLMTTVVRLTSDGQEKAITIPWQLKDICRLLYAQWAYRAGLLNDEVITPSTRPSPPTSGPTA